MPDDVRNDPEHRRFELEVEGHKAFAYYRLEPGVITFIHTEVPPELGGRGIGSRLIKGALEEVRRQGLRVVAQCPFVGGYIAKHQEFGDLL
jgi:predicted GNAT family acetyltransferase